MIKTSGGYWVVNVLILVLMEYPLITINSEMAVSPNGGLNPCSNGIPSDSIFTGNDRYGR